MNLHSNRFRCFDRPEIVNEKAFVSLTSGDLAGQADKTKGSIETRRGSRFVASEGECMLSGQDKKEDEIPVRYLDGLGFSVGLIGAAALSAC